MTKRITKKQKQIINDILQIGLGEFWYGDDLERKLELSLRYNVLETDIDFCLTYIEEKFYFWNAVN